MTTFEIQRRLKALGYDPGPLDGVRGRLTIRAIKAFQADRKLAADGIVGPLTTVELFGRDGGIVPPAEARRQLMPWYEEALRLKGTREAAGAADNPLILTWAKRLGLAYGSDSTAWCGLFVGHCIAAALPDEPLPANPLGARKWASFGAATEPTLGAVLVFWRGSKSGWKGHVGFYAGEDSSAYHVLGGNQSDSVSIARLGKNRLLDARWPNSVPPPAGGATKRAAAGSLSTNEA
jgi:uncharacterized protein (TIGR02594 family)